MSSAHHINLSRVELSQPALLTPDFEQDYAGFLDHLPDLSELRGKTLVVECDNSAKNARFLLSAWIHHLTCYLLPRGASSEELEKTQKLTDADFIISSDEQQDSKAHSFNHFDASEKNNTKFSFESSHVPFVIQTSGSTGTPKWVPVFNRQLFTAFQSSAAFVRPASGEFWLSVLPLHHIGGLSIWLRSFHRKSGVALMKLFEAEDILTFMKKHTSIRYASFVPTMLRRLTQMSDAPFKHKRTILLGGGPASASLIRDAVKMNLDVITSFGMSETAAQITGYRYASNNLPDDSRLWSGPVQPPNQFRLTGEGPANEGLLWLKGPQVFEGYRHHEEDQPFEGEWFNTGDYARFSPRHGLQILMRRSDRIISGGENIDPVKVQDEIRKLDGVKDVIVMGIDDEEWGQKVVAFCVTKNSEITRTTIKKNCALHSFEIPREVICMSELPSLANGKIDRQRLKELV